MDRSSHVARRREHGLTYRELAQEFGCAPSTAHRIVTAQRMSTEQQRMQEGQALRLAKEGD